MGISLTEASKEVNITKAGLVKAIKKGRLSAEKNDAGEWMVEPSELFRVYPKVKPVGANLSLEVGVGIDPENKALKREVELLREQLDRANLEKDRVLKMLEEQIVNVRLLTDQRQEKPEEKRGFLARLFG